MRVLGHLRTGCRRYSRPDGGGETHPRRPTEASRGPSLVPCSSDQELVLIWAAVEAVVADLEVAVGDRIGVSVTRDLLDREG